MTGGDKRSRLLAIGALVTAVPLALAGCAQTQTAADDAQAGAHGSLSITLEEPGSPLTPAAAADPAAMQIVDSMWTGLVATDPDTGQPRLANAAQISTKDNTTWTVELKPNWRFSDGSPVTADSYVDAWNWAAACQHHTANQALFGPSAADIAGYAATAGSVGTSGRVNCPERITPLAGLHVVGDAAFTITLEHPVAVLESILSSPAFAPLPDSFFTDPEVFAAHPVGNGPYRFDSRTAGGDIRLRADPNYAGDDRPRIDEVTWRIDKDPDADYADLRAGRLDMMSQLPADVVAADNWREELGPGHFAVESDGTFTTVTIPATNPRFASPDIRVALSRAVDRPLIAMVTEHGTVLPADSWTAPRLSGAAAGTCGTTCGYDLFAAQDLLERGGGLPEGISIAFAEDSGDTDVVHAVCASITKTLSVPCLPQPFGSAPELAAGIKDGSVLGLFVSTWRADYPSAQVQLAPVYGSDGANPGGYSNPAFDAMMATAAALPQPQADDKYVQSQSILTRTVPAIPLWAGTSQLGWTPKVLTAGAVTTPQGTIDLTRLDVAVGD